MYATKGPGCCTDGTMRNLRACVERTDPRGSYYFEPTWRVNGCPISDCDPLEPPFPNNPLARGYGPRARQVRFDLTPAQVRSLQANLRQHLWGLRSSELREIIMNLCLKNLDTHRDVVAILKRMQKRRPRPIAPDPDNRVRNPTAGLYLYCRTQRELVDIVLEISRYDEMDSFAQDVKDLVMVIRDRAQVMGEY
ncbi:hypothetical protein F4808DRAFT_437810 [Astrocystis sublimbata]|nr:hypothetical protein F4808DRAFT_437810 [Astrocystis sublimbata]